MVGEPYHVGFVVDDLAEAMDRYERVLGVEFREPELRRLVRGGGAGLAEAQETFEVRFTYSVGERPYVELIEAGPGGPVFGPEQGEGFHHVGMWMADLDAARAATVEAGGRVEGRFFLPDGSDRVSFASVCGVRAEFVSESARGASERWLADGRPRTRG